MAMLFGSYSHTHIPPDQLDVPYYTPRCNLKDLHNVILENATHCGASLSEQLKSVVGFLQLLKTVLFDFAKNAGILTLSGLGDRRED